MKREVEQFFNKRNLSFRTLLRTSCRGLGRANVAKAMEEVYGNHKKIRPIEYGWQVRRLAALYKDSPPLHVPDEQEFLELQEKADTRLDIIKALILGYFLGGVLLLNYWKF